MSGLLSNLLQAVRDRRGKDMRFLCHRLLSERGEASQTALAQEIIKAYKGMDAAQRLGFFEMLCREFSPDEAAVRQAAADYERTPNTKALAALSDAVEPPRQELIRRINTAPGGTETLVALRGHLLDLSRDGKNLAPIDTDLRHLFRSWFNPGFLRLERISWRTSAFILEKLIRYESVHEINGWADLRRRLEADRRCFAFFHPALLDEPIIFVEVALTNGLGGELEPLLDINAPVRAPDKADTAIFYSINNCLNGLRNVPFGNFLIKQVVAELAAELPNLRNYGTLSPLPNLSRALKDRRNEEGFTPNRLSRLLADYAADLTAAAKLRDPVEAFFHLLEAPLSHRDLLAAPLRRVALAYLTKAHRGERLYDPVATFHLSNGARLERINTYGNLRPYGLEASFGVTVNYRYILSEVEENHERFVRGRIQVSGDLFREYKTVRTAWQPTREKSHAGEDSEAAAGRSSHHAA
ncbi:MAG TPA: malonyl-CoA decarboxylase family protein [Candidatus Dormibacteraeota bacterium]|nr:malonyl-CoA decarboxylase family protein [Candidatus Dormibacteraeota bacterium]